MSRFLRIRSFVLACIFAICFLWSILLSVAVCFHWPLMNSVEREFPFFFLASRRPTLALSGNLVSIMLVVEFMTVILVPILCVFFFQQSRFPSSKQNPTHSLARDFQLWLDAARSLFVFTSHFGIAVWFACKVPEMKCVVSGESEFVFNGLALKF